MILIIKLFLNTFNILLMTSITITSTLTITITITIIGITVVSTVAVIRS